MPPGDVLMACSGQLPVQALLEAVPHTFAADTLAGAWATCYRFSQPPKCHADIARLEVVSGRRVRIANYPPEPRTQGHAEPFRNEIEATLANRHLAGSWKNTSDARYFGTIHLAVMPGETVMEGFFTNFVDDVHVSTGFWKWVRIEPGVTGRRRRGGDDSAGSAELHALLEAHSQYGAPLCWPTLERGTLVGLTKQDVRDVMAIYIRAWQDQDPDLIVTIFTEHATYHERVMRDPIPDREAIRAYWASKVVGAQANITCKLLNLYLDGDTAIAEWLAEFDDVDEGVRKRMKEIAVLDFEGHLIASLREYWASEEVGQAAAEQALAAR